MTTDHKDKHVDGALKAPPRRDPEAWSLPHNLDAERSCLGAALVERSAADYIVGKLKREHFWRRAHQDVFDAIGRLREERKDVDFLTLRSALEAMGKLNEVGGPAYVSSLADGVPQSANVQFYAGIVMDLAARRALVMYAERTIDLVATGEHTAREMLLDADRRLLDLQAGRIETRLQSVQDTATDLYRDIEWRIQNQGVLTGLDTGFPSLNDDTGGWQAGDLVVIAARPSIGKTTFALNSAVSTALSSRRRDTNEPVRVAVFSLEMRRRQLEFRILSQLSQVELTRLQKGVLGERDYSRISHAMEQLRGLHIAIDDRAGQSALDIRSACRRMKTETKGLDLVVVDYVQLMPGTLDRRGATRNDEITDISRRLKDLADEVSAPVLLLSQLRRIEGRPRIDDLRESGSLEQVADVVVLLHRKDHQANGNTECMLAKQRNGPTGTRLLTVQRETVTFTDGGSAAEAEAQQTEEKVERKKTRARTFAQRYRQRGDS